MRIAHTDELSSAELAAIRALLAETFAGSFGEHDWVHALGGLHVLLDEEGDVVSHASVVPRAVDVGGRPLATGYVEAVATRADRRGRGMGTAVMEAIGEHIRATYQLGALSTGETGFYRRLGWEIWRGPSFVEAEGAPEPTPGEDGGIMVLRTPATPALDPTAPIVCDRRAGDVW